MLAVRLTEVLFPWQMALLLGVLALWLVLGGLLLWWGTQRLIKYRWASRRQSLLTNLIGVVAGQFANISIIFLGSVWDAPGAIAGIVVGVIVSVLTMWYVIAYRLDIPYRRAIIAWLPKLAEIVVIAPLLVLILLPTQRAMTIKRQDEKCAANLRSLFREITRSSGQSPDPNEVLRRDQAWLHCPAAANHHRIDYFYLPLSLDEADDQMRIMACDFRTNHLDPHARPRGRNVYYGSGEILWLSENDFQTELNKPRNASFAAALNKVDR